MQGRSDKPTRHVGDHLTPCESWLTSILRAGGSRCCKATWRLLVRKCQDQASSHQVMDFSEASNHNRHATEPSLCALRIVWQRNNNNPF